MDMCPEPTAQWPGAQSLPPHIARTKLLGTATLTLLCGFCLGWGLPGAGGWRFGEAWAPSGNEARSCGSQVKGMAASWI